MGHPPTDIENAHAHVYSHAAVHGGRAQSTHALTSLEQRTSACKAPADQSLCLVDRARDLRLNTTGKQVLRSTQAPHASSNLSCALSRICLLRIPLICPNPLTLVFPNLDLAAP